MIVSGSGEGEQDDDGESRADIMTWPEEDKISNIVDLYYNRID